MLTPEESGVLESKVQAQSGNKRGYRKQIYKTGKLGILTLEFKFLSG